MSLLSYTPVSIIQATGATAGVLSNPGDCTLFYFENPLYAPIVIRPVPRNGQMYSSTLGDGMLVQPFTWIQFPIDPSEDVVYQCDVYHSISGASRSVAFTQRGLFSLEAGVSSAYPNVYPQPIMARYFFSNSQDNGIRKGSIFRHPSVLDSRAPAITIEIGSSIFGTYLTILPLPAGVLSVTPKFRPGGILSNFQEYGASSGLRAVITGLQNTISAVRQPVVDTEMGYAFPVKTYYDEFTQAGVYFPDIIGPGIGIPLKNRVVSDSYVPVAGGRWITVDTTSVASSGVAQQLGVYFSEY